MSKIFSIQKVHSFERLRIITIKWIYPKSQNNCNWSSSLVSNQISFFSKYSIFKHLPSSFSLSTSYKIFHVFFLLLFFSFPDQKLSFSNITLGEKYWYHLTLGRSGGQTVDTRSIFGVSLKTLGCKGSS